MTKTLLSCPVCGKSETVDVEFGGALPKHTIDYCLEGLKDDIDNKEEEVEDLEYEIEQLEKEIEEMKEKVNEFEPGCYGEVLV